MLRNLLTQADKPVEVLKVGAALTRGAFVYKDGSDDELKVLTSGLGDDIVDICKNYDGVNSIKDPTDGSTETIAENTQAIRVPTLIGEKYATSEVTRNYADKGDPMTVSNGKLVKATGSAAYQWIYDGTHADPSGVALHSVEKVVPATAPASRTVTYDKNTGTGTLTDPRSPYFVGKKAVVLSNTFVPPAYYTFGAWDTAANGSGTNYDAGDEITIAASNIALYAQWVATYAGILYDKNGGTGTMVDGDSPYAVDATVTVLDNEFTPPENKGFSNWNTADDGSGTSYDPDDEITIVSGDLGSAKTLYAIWSDLYSVTYDANTGTGTMADTNSPYLSGGLVTVLANAFTPPTGKVFSSWNTTAAGDGTTYAAAATFTISANTTLYAIWADA